MNSQTPIFEYTGPHNRIVIDHQDEKLTLLAIRNIETGDYMPYTGMNTLAEFYDIPVVKPYQGTIDDLARATDIEGVVIRFDDGHMVKVKTSWYVAIHKAKENILFEKNVLELILEEKIDDILPHLPEKDKIRLENYQKGISFAIKKLCMIQRNIISSWIKSGMSRKEFAINKAPTLHPFDRKIAFMMWDNPDVSREDMRNIVVQQLLKLCNSQVDIDAHRAILGVKWNPTGDVIHDAKGNESLSDWG